MTNNYTAQYIDPVSQGICQALGCSGAAKHRVSWAGGVVVKLVCPTHKAQVEGKLFEDLGLSIFENTRHAKRRKAILCVVDQPAEVDSTNVSVFLKDDIVNNDLPKGDNAKAVGIEPKAA